MYEAERDVLFRTCREMENAGLVLGSAGNGSYRVRNHVVLTPSSVRYDEMGPADMLVMDLDGGIVESTRKPSIETAMHLEIYRQRDDVQAIVHTHSLYASAMSLLNMSLPPILDEMVHVFGGEVRLSPYAMAGTEELAENVVKNLENRNALLLANHGAICCGDSLRDAFQAAMLLERCCKIYVTALQVGKPISQLPEKAVDAQKQAWLKKQKSKS
ncbi:MAG: class II aldolase/adducin family protein [Candidatus Lokiarchaeota archaeon]|nr:class II aldolase/adducin family protein [Candidatus Lokiarchaeota archaeon]